MFSGSWDDDDGETARGWRFLGPCFWRLPWDDEAFFAAKLPAMGDKAAAGDIGGKDDSSNFTSSRPTRLLYDTEVPSRASLSSRISASTELPRRFDLPFSARLRDRDVLLDARSPLRDRHGHVPVAPLTVLPAPNPNVVPKNPNVLISSSTKARTAPSLKSATVFPTYFTSPTNAGSRLSENSAFIFPDGSTSTSMSVTDEGFKRSASGTVSLCESPATRPIREQTIEQCVTTHTFAVPDSLSANSFAYIMHRRKIFSSDCRTRSMMSTYASPPCASQYGSSHQAAHSPGKKRWISDRRSPLQSPRSIAVRSESICGDNGFCCSAAINSAVIAARSKGEQITSANFS
mmetsp:Transcript_16958/g.42034  ORF Transcript_16958/g.42034 Transcript_16958/m.42034 type:complete len:347 (-) Transcript_16958:3658-4698(-)